MRTSTVTIAALLLAGCSFSNVRSVPSPCEFPEGVPIAFAGETTMEDLGIPAAGKERELVYAWVTAAAIRFPSTPDAHRAACVERVDGSFERSVFPGALLRSQAP